MLSYYFSFINQHSYIYMRPLFFIILCLVNHVAAAQQKTYGMADFSASEGRAFVIITKVRETISLSDLQAGQLAKIAGEYSDGLQQLNGAKNYEEKLAKLLAKRDQKTLEVLKDPELSTSYQKKFDSTLAAQNTGYGRRR